MTGTAKIKTLSMGTYPDTSLADARKRRDEARRKLEAGTDPGVERRLTEDAPDRTFEAVAAISPWTCADSWKLPLSGIMQPSQIPDTSRPAQ